MPLDSKGAEVALNDGVLLRGHVRLIQEGEDGTNVLFESDLQLFPAPQRTVFWCNAKQLEGLGPDPVVPADTNPPEQPAPVVPVPPDELPAADVPADTTEPEKEA